MSSVRSHLGSAHEVTSHRHVRNFTYIQAWCPFMHDGLLGGCLHFATLWVCAGRALKVFCCHPDEQVSALLRLAYQLLSNLNEFYKTLVGGF